MLIFINEEENLTLLQRSRFRDMTFLHPIIMKTTVKIVTFTYTVSMQKKLTAPPPFSSISCNLNLHRTTCLVTLAYMFVRG